MIEKYPKLFWGAIAFAIYFTFVGLLLFYFNTHSMDKTKHYVKKDEQRIKVALNTTPLVKKKKNNKVQKKNHVKRKKKSTKIKSKIFKKKVIKEKRVKKIVKKHDENKTKIKKHSTEKQRTKKTLDLFSGIKTKDKKSKKIKKDEPQIPKINTNTIEIKDKPKSASERISSTLKIQNNSDSGVVNAYFTKVQKMLENWPAQTEFAGEKAKVILYIKTSGAFEFKVKTGSNIEAFNNGLIAFLKQLQSIGLGAHTGGRTYEYEVEFIAKE